MRGKTLRTVGIWRDQIQRIWKSFIGSFVNWSSSGNLHERILNSREFIDTLGLHILLPFELDGLQHSVSLMLALRILEHFDSRTDTVWRWLLTCSFAFAPAMALASWRLSRQRRCPDTSWAGLFSVPKCNASRTIPNLHAGELTDLIGEFALCSRLSMPHGHA